MSTEVVIEAKGLSKKYGAFQALRDASFQVRRGEVLGFLGPNGAGKTTTMKILTCYIAPSEGEARVAGCDLFDDPIGVRRAIGYLPESTPLYTEMQVHEYLQFMGEMRGLRGAALKKASDTAVEQTSLTEVLHKEIRQLSKGYKQRVGLAQALIHEPPLLILDEPMSGLDPNQAAEIRELIRAIGKERTVILSTHNLAEVQVTCQRVLIVAKGRIVADDTTQDLQYRAGRAKILLSFLPSAKGFGSGGAFGAEQGLGAAEASSASLAERAAQVMRGVPGVQDVRVSANGGPQESQAGVWREEDALSGSQTRAPGEVVLEVVPRDDSDLRPALFRAAVDANLTLVGLRREGQDLERVFRELTMEAAS